MKSVSSISIVSGSRDDSYGIHPSWKSETGESVDDLSILSDESFDGMELDLFSEGALGAISDDIDEASETFIGERSMEPATIDDYPSVQTGELHLKGMALEGADFAKSSLEIADFSQANLRMADFAQADLRGANFQNADLTFSDLSGANLSGAGLGFAELEKANLRSAHLRGAKLNSACLNHADLTEADLRGADLGGASLVATRLVGALFDDSTILPFSINEAVSRGMNLRMARGSRKENADA